MKRHLRALISIFALLAAFGAGMVAQHLQQAEADTSQQGLTTVVYEILAGGSPTIARVEPNEAAAEVDTLRWGDRVLWDGQTQQTDANGSRWIRVFTATGELGWIPANIADINTRLRASTATYLTAGIEVGGTVTVTSLGDRANLRTSPSTTSDLVRTVDAGETLTVVGGPYSAEYLMWWQYEDTQGNTGWIIDIQDWFQPAQ